MGLFRIRYRRAKRGRDQSQSYVPTSASSCLRVGLSRAPPPSRALRPRALRISMSDSQPMNGLLIAFEGLDQSGKQTQAERLRDQLTARGRECRLLSFPDYETRDRRGDRASAPRRARLRRRRHAAAVRRQPLRTTRRDRRAGSPAGMVLVCDRYLASSIAYGEAQGSTARGCATSSGSCRSRT